MTNAQTTTTKRADEVRAGDTLNYKGAPFYVETVGRTSDGLVSIVGARGSLRKRAATLLEVAS